MTITIVNGIYQFVCENLTVTGFEYPSVNAVIEDVYGSQGAKFISSKFGRRPLSWQGVITENVLENRRNLIRACRAGALKAIYFETCDGIALQADIEVLNVVAPYHQGRAKYLIQAVAPDSRFYSQELMSIDIQQTAIRGGTSIPFLTIPVSIPQSTLTDSELNSIITNDGSEEVDPIFTITGPGTTFTVENVSTGQQFIIDGTLAEGETYTVNVKEGTVIKNISTNAYPDFTGDFITLEPGDNEFRFVIGTGVGVNTLLNVQYRNGYAGI